MGDHVGLAITGRCGPIEHERSEVVEGRWRRGIFFAEDSWDGSDLFAAEGEGAGWPYVSERARDALLGAGLRGLDFEPLPELKYWD